MGKSSILNRVVRGHLADHEMTSTQKPEEEREGALQNWI